ncbi:TraR/DksA family transcriptional regulator [Rubritalea spongiae]|uniref:TraR/DksA family transcriptional regulator n=1 Tax=Rubritalea spongiae TaxID=430797 RepID=A0ABW5E050_9BACT
MAVNKKQASKVARKAVKKTAKKNAVSKKVAKKSAKKAAEKAPKKVVKTAKPSKKTPTKKVAKKSAKKQVVKKAVKKPSKKPISKTVKTKSSSQAKLVKKAKKPSKSVKKLTEKSSPPNKASEPKNSKKKKMKETLNKPVKLTAFVKKQHKRLLDLRDELVDTTFDKAQDTLRNHPEGSEANGSGMHQGDAGSDAYDRDLALNILGKEHDALYEIEEAIRRVERGTYGICEMSGEKIPKERLEAIPFCRLTVQCQEKWEAKHGKNRYRREDEAGYSGLTL